MKKILPLLVIGALMLTAGCANTAVPAETSSSARESEPEQSRTESAPRDNMRGDANDGKADPPGFRGENNQDGVMGKITAISGNTVTLALGTASRSGNVPEGRGTPPGREGAQPAPERGSDGSMPDGGRPAERDRGGPGGRTPGGFSDLEYSGEEMSYTISDDVPIRKGMGGNGEDLHISDLAEGDILRLLLDEAEQPVSVQVFEAGRENG